MWIVWVGGLDGKERAKWNTLERGEVQNWVPVDRLEPGIKRWIWTLTVVFCVGAGAVLCGLVLVVIQVICDLCNGKGG